MPVSDQSALIFLDPEHGNEILWGRGYFAIVLQGLI